jgi:Asp-tRNA(Asn)/Glu-tRNA(Gln) amidotransferase A subunit family amidase
MSDHSVDLWLTPAATGPAPLGLGTTGDSVMCLPWSNAGFPSVTLPAGRAANGLPLGLQYVARPGSDEELLAWAAALQALQPTSSRSRT